MRIEASEILSCHSYPLKLGESISVEKGMTLNIIVWIA